MFCSLLASLDPQTLKHGHHSSHFSEGKTETQRRGRRLFEPASTKGHLGFLAFLVCRLEMVSLTAPPPQPPMAALEAERPSTASSLLCPGYPQDRQSPGRVPGRPGCLPQLQTMMLAKS